MAEKENKTGLIVLAVLGVLAAAGGVYSIVSAVRSGQTVRSVYSATVLKNAALTKNTKSLKSSGEYIAVLSVEGVLEEKNETYDQRWLLNTIDTLQHDPKNRAILLEINSPGGGIFEADEVYLALGDYKNAGKTVWAYMEQMAASGGYYISCAADVIYANRNTLTGSIGVIIGPAIDISELMQKYGVKTTFFTSGKNKNMLGFDHAVTKEQADIMQSLVDDAYEQFASIIAESRKMPLDVVKQLADGRLYTAKQAQSHGLIDIIARFEDAITALQFALVGEGTEISVEYFEPKQRQSIYDWFKNMDYLFESTAENILSRKTLQKLLQRIAVPEYRLQ